MSCLGPIWQMALPSLVAVQLGPDANTLSRSVHAEDSRLVASAFKADQRYFCTCLLRFGMVNGSVVDPIRPVV